MPAPFDVTRFQELLVTRTFGRNLVFEPSVGSTMDIARDAAARGAAEGTLVVADEQTAGRGRLERSWVTPPAANLTTTLVLRPHARVMRQVAMIAPLAICRAVDSVVGLPPDIKWPNDVQMGGRKLAGILIETVSDDTGGTTVLVGAGVNVNFDARQVEEIRDIATTLYAEFGREVQREALLAAYVLEFERLYDGARAGASPRDEWRARLVTIGQAVHAAWPGGSVEGVAEGVDDDGSLLVRTDAGELVAVEAGDVTLRG